MFEELKKRSIQARKNKSREAILLSTLLSEVKTKAKDDNNREATDEDVHKLAEKFMKGALGNRDLLDQAGRSTDEPDFEISVLEGFLPKQMDEKETFKIVEQAIKTTNPSSIKDMGKVMGYLKKEHGSSIDMKLAGTFVKEKMNG